MTGVKKSNIQEAGKLFMNRKEWLKQSCKAITNGQKDYYAYSSPSSALKTYLDGCQRHFNRLGAYDLKHYGEITPSDFGILTTMIAERECELFRLYRITAEKQNKKLPDGNKISYYNSLSKRQLVNKLIDANNSIYNFINRFEDWNDPTFRKYAESHNGLNWDGPRK